MVAAAAIIAVLCEGLFEPLGFAAAAILVWAVIAACLVGRVFELAPIGRLAVLAGLLLGITTALVLASTIWANDQGRAFEEGVRALLYLGVFVLAVCTAGEYGRRRWVAGLAIGLAVAGFIALFAYLQPGTLESGRSDIPNAAGRLSYPIGYWNGAASLLAIAAVLLAFCAANASTRALRAASVAAIPAMVLAVWLTSSRGGLGAIAIGWAVLIAASRSRGRLVNRIAVGAAGGILLVLIAVQLDPLDSGSLDSARRAAGDWMSLWVVLATVAVGTLAWAEDAWIPRWRLSGRLRIALLVALLIGAVVGIAAADPAEKYREFTATPAPDAVASQVGVNSNGRWQFWKSAADAFGGSPVHGLGAGGWEAYWGTHSTIPRFARNPHSLPLQAAAELGVPGIALMLSFIVVLCLSAARRIRGRIRGDGPVLAAVLSAAAIGAAVDWTWQIPAVVGPAVICAGLLVGSAPPPLGARRAWEGRLTLAVAWLAMAASAAVLIGDVEVRRSRDAADAGRLDEAIARARDAQTFEPWASGPYVQLALLREAQRDFPKALADLHEAQRRDIGDWRLSLIEARLERRVGNATAARMALQRARADSPFSTGPG